MMSHNLSHILVWSTSQNKSPSDVLSVDTIELTRVNLTFKVKRVAMVGGSIEHFSSLYIMVMYFITGLYREVFKMVESCVSEELNVEELKIFSQLEFLGSDFHPDAHACRLKLSALTIGLGASSLIKCHWSVQEKMTEYVRKFLHISSTCRLTNKTMITSRFVCSAYFRPEEDKIAFGGIKALEFINSALNSGIEVTSGQYGFPLIYDMLVGTVNFNLHPSDRTHNWGRIFMRLLPARDFRSNSAEMSALKILSENRTVATHPNTTKF